MGPQRASVKAEQLRSAKAPQILFASALASGCWLVIPTRERLLYHIYVNMLAACGFARGDQSQRRDDYSAVGPRSKPKDAGIPRR